MVKIEQVKEELESAKLVRKNKEEYDELARMVTEKPSREKTARNLEKLEASLTQLHDTQKELELKLAEKKQKVQALTALLDDFIEVPGELTVLVILSLLLFCNCLLFQKNEILERWR